MFSFYFLLIFISDLIKTHPLLQKKAEDGGVKEQKNKRLLNRLLSIKKESSAEKPSNPL